MHVVYLNIMFVSRSVTSCDDIMILVCWHEVLNLPRSHDSSRVGSVNFRPTCWCRRSKLVFYGRLLVYLYSYTVLFLVSLLQYGTYGSISFGSNFQK